MKKILKQDKVYLEQRLAELHVIARQISREIEEALTQSSETWHDNAPFEALIDKEKTLRSEQEILEDYLDAQIISHEHVPDIVCEGVVCTLEDETGTHTYGIGGDFIHQDMHTVRVVSSKSMIAQTLCGARVGDTVLFTSPRNREVTIVSIENYA